MAANKKVPTKNYKSIPTKTNNKSHASNKKNMSQTASNRWFVRGFDSTPKKFIYYVGGLLLFLCLGSLGYYKFVNQSKAATTSTFNYATYGFPAPNNPNPVLSTSYYKSFKTMWNNYMGSPAVTAASKLGIDPGMIGGWTLHEQNPSTFYNLCGTTWYRPDYYCSTSNAGNWQVGYGIQPLYEYDVLKEAFNAMHSGKSVAQVGNAVITASQTRSSKGAISSSYSFPSSITIDQIIADRNSSTNRVRLGILFMDDKIGTYAVGKHMKGYMATGTRMATTFKNWPPAGYYSPQKVSNSFAAAYVVNNGENPTVSLVAPISKTFPAGTTSVKLDATPISPVGRQVQVAWRIRKGSDCTTARTSSGPWTPLTTSGNTQGYTFTSLTKGTYYWSAKAQDSTGLYSKGATFCGSDGWADAKSFTIQ